jgi:hypothetical protein
MRLFGMVSGGPPPLYPFTNFTFTGFLSNSGTGQGGPSLAQIISLSIYNFVTYPWLNNTAYFNVIGNGYQIWTVPATGTYSIDAYGAGGGGTQGTLNTDAGSGARIKGEFFLTAGTKLRIVVGQKGSPGDSVSTAGRSGGGGGGTFVMKETGTTNSDIYVIAGGGGGGSYYSGVSKTGGNGSATSGNGSGGTAGSLYGSGGGSILSFGSNGTSSSGGASFATTSNGGNAYNSLTSVGGFGGGGGNGFYGGGGGGGQTGGGGGRISSDIAALGGSSFNNGTNQINTAGANINAGQVIITRL